MGQATIFAGSKIKTLKSTLNLNGGADIISSSVDPTATATDGAPGSLLLNTTSGKLYRKNDSGSSTNWEIVGSGAGGINYVTNPDAESNTTGWITYADAAGAQPVDGAGGSPNITWTRSTTSPLRGVADFVLTKDAANRQGQGVATDLLINLADQAKQLVISLNYEILSGTYADGDIGVYIIADPAGTPVVIQPAGFQVQSLGSGTKGRLVATFQTLATGQTYRLCLHVASTSAQAYSLAVDTVQVGPQNVTFSTPVTDWVSYTPTLTNGNNTTPTAQWRRVGSSIEIKGGIQWNAAGAGSTLLFSLPPGLTFASSAGDVAGSGFAFTGAGFQTVSVRATVGSNTLFFARTGDASNFSGSQALSSAWSIAFEGTWPVTGWATSAQVVSDSSEGRVVAATMFAATTTSLANGTPTVVNLTSTSVDTIGGWNGSNTYTVRVPGVYSISGMVNFATNATGTRATSYRVNGADYTGGLIASAGGAIRTRVPGAPLVLRLAAGSTIQLLGYQDSGAALNAENFESFLSIQLIQGSQTLLGGETVAASGSRTAGNVATSGNAATFVWNSMNVDTTGSMNTSTGVYTAPSPGLYEVIASPVVFSTVSQSLQTIIRVNSVDVANGFITQDSTNSNYRSVPVSWSGRLLAGQTIDVRVASGGAATWVGDNGTVSRISIKRVGNY